MNVFQFIKKHPYITFLFIIIITRIIYSLVGVYSRGNLADKLNSFDDWTYDHKNEAVNVWTVWDSGFYYDIAKNGYPKDIKQINKFTLKLEPFTWYKVFLGYGEVGQDRFILPSNAFSKISNTLFVVGSHEKATEVDLYAVYPGISYCKFRGVIDFERDVKNVNQALTNGSACGDVACTKSYATYYQDFEKKVVFQEFFDANNTDVPVKVFGDVRPAGFSQVPYEGLGCTTISQEELTQVSNLDYITKRTPLGFMPLYPTLARALSYAFKDIIVAGLFISNLFLFISAIFLYEFLKKDFDESFSFYATLLYLVYPFGFISSGFFTEALFNALFFAALYFARQKQFIYSNILTAFLGVTRLLGLFTILPLLFIYKRTLRKKQFIASLISMLIIPIPLALHVLRLHNLTGDWLVLVKAHDAFGREIEGFFSSLIHYMTVSGNYGDFELLVFIVSAVLVITFLVKAKTKDLQKIPYEYGAVAFYMFLIPLASGILTSFPRYTLTLLPIYPALVWVYSKTNYKWLLLILTFVFSVVLMGVWTLSSRLIV